MTRRLGVNGRRKGVAALAAVSLAALLAMGATSAGCGGGDNGGGSTQDSGTGGETSSGGDTGAPKPDTGADTGGPQDSGQPDTNQPDVPLPKAATPTCAPAAGTFTSAQSVTLSDTTSGATVFYTLDHTNPSASSTVYSTPLSISKTTEVRAMASAPGFQNSDVASCTYTINIQPGTCNPPGASPVGGTYNNDFPASLSVPTTGGGTACNNICFTLDGSDPTCDQTTGNCIAPAQTYNAQNRIPINGTVTGNPAVGEVVLKAIACQANTTPTPMAAVTYKLQVSTPTLQGPAPDPTAHTYAKGTSLTPTVASTTNGATGLYNVSAGILTTDPNNTSCTNGKTLGSLPSTGQLSLTEASGNQTAFVVGCKAGYIDSTPVIAPYTITLNEPNVGTTQPGTFDQIQNVTLNDSLNGGIAAGNEWACVSTTATPPTCSATACGAGTQYTDGNQIKFATNKRTAAGAGDANANGSVVTAVVCSQQAAGKPVFATPAQSFTSGAYNFKLDAIAFTCSTTSAVAGFAACDAAHSTVPNGGSVWVNAAETAATGQETYDFTCVSTDSTVPDCTCNTTSPSTLQKFPAGTPATVKFTKGGTVRAVGCLASPSANGFGDVFQQSDTPPASQAVTGTQQMAPPTIEQCTPTNTNCSTSASMNNPQQVQFLNSANNPDNAYFCYTVNNTAVQDNSAGPTCFAANTKPGDPGNTSTQTYCTGVGTQPGKISTDGPFGASNTNGLTAAITTGQWIHAIACDATGAYTPSVEAPAVQFTLVVGTPVITTKGAVNLGQTIVIKSATLGATIQYSTDGTTPDCTAAYASITAATAGPPDANGLYSTNYYAMGQETGALTVIGCKTGYTVSPGTDNTTFSYSMAKPVIGYFDSKPQFVVAPSGTIFDDYVNSVLAQPVDGSGGGVAGTWYCVGANAGCSPTAGQCTGSGSFPFSPSCSNVTLSGSTAHSGGQPAGAPVCIGLGDTLPDPFLSGLAPAFVACAPTEPATGAVKASGATNVTYNFQNSAVALTSPAAMTTAGAVTFAGVATTTPPDGDANATPVVKGATSGDGSGSGTASGTNYICASPSATIASLGGQPSDCAGFASAPPPGWSCQASSTGAFDPGPTLTLADQGNNATYAVFSCKNFMTWSNGSFPVTFTPYVHTPTFVMNGATSDFFAGETLAASNGGTAYVTFDQSNLYVGYQGTIAATDIIHFYVGSKSGGTSTADTVLAGQFGSANLPANFNALYHVYWYADNTKHGTDKFSGSWAADGDQASVKYNGTNFVEFSIPLNQLGGTNGDLHLLGGDWNGTVQVGAWPSGNPNNIGAAVTPAWSTWQAEILTSAWTPNDAHLVNLQ